MNETTGELVEHTGETPLPLRTAMNNTRLLARTDRDWLNPIVSADAESRPLHVHRRAVGKTKESDILPI
ncbi:hypothetical protein ABIA35_009108 [Catenulispora sp. MAP12-49]|uniref:hypothetical protein n=1 Tax=Catenulispora sp. MAP12-49 TaxID=3156302 RepID=UPI003519B078